jgi:hypothetical protein
MDRDMHRFVQRYRATAYYAGEAPLKSAQLSLLMVAGTAVWRALGGVDGAPRASGSRRSARRGCVEASGSWQWERAPPHWESPRWAA